jgi:hypothetical protein
MPESVEMPAPVRTTIRSDPCTISLARSTLDRIAQDQM